MSKTIFVFGASRGIGKEIVSKFSKLDDYKVYAFSRSFKTETQGSIHFCKLDLESETLQNDLKNLISEVKTVDIVINNAGQIVVKPFLELTQKEIQSCYQVNVSAVMQTLQVCIPKMKKGGHIVNISSIGGFQGTLKFAGLSAYSTSKAAVVSLTELLAEEFKDSGISINCLCLGAVQTEMLETAFPGYQAPHSATEMAEFIVDFSLNSGRFMHGKVIPVSISTP